MASQVFVLEQTLPSTRLLTLPTTFSICIGIHSVESNINNGGNNNQLGSYPTIQDGGLDDNLFFFAKIENPN